MNRLTLVACAILLAAAATLSAQMHELGHWHGGHFLEPGDSGYRDRNESRQEFRRDYRDLRQRRLEALREQRRSREEFRHDMRAGGRQWRYKFRGDRWN